MVGPGDGGGGEGGGGDGGGGDGGGGDGGGASTLKCSSSIVRTSLRVPSSNRLIGFAGSYSMKTCSMPMMSVFRKA